MYVQHQTMEYVSFPGDNLQKCPLVDNFYSNIFQNTSGLDWFGVHVCKTEITISFISKRFVNYSYKPHCITRKSTVEFIYHEFYLKLDQLIGHIFMTFIAWNQLSSVLSFKIFSILLKFSTCSVLPVCLSVHHVHAMPLEARRGCFLDLEFCGLNEMFP